MCIRDRGPASPRFATGLPRVHNGLVHDPRWVCLACNCAGGVLRNWICKTAVAPADSMHHYRTTFTMGLCRVSAKGLSFSCGVKPPRSECVSEYGPAFFLREQRGRPGFTAGLCRVHNGFAKPANAILDGICRLSVASAGPKHPTRPSSQRVCDGFTPGLRKS